MRPTSDRGRFLLPALWNLASRSRALPPLLPTSTTSTTWAAMACRAARVSRFRSSSCSGRGLRSRGPVGLLSMLPRTTGRRGRRSSAPVAFHLEEGRSDQTDQPAHLEAAEPTTGIRGLSFLSKLINPKERDQERGDRDESGD